MAVTPSSMLPLGSKASDFVLLETVSNNKMSLKDLKSDKGTVIVFMCNHCPYVKHILPQLIDVARYYHEKGIQFIAISSNDIKNYPDDSPEEMQKLAKEMHFPFPYLHDESQKVAKAYQAECTPDFYLFDQNLLCVYRGRFDGATPGNDLPVTGEDLCNALDNLLNGEPISDQQEPSMGCNIKWKN